MESVIPNPSEMQRKHEEFVAQRSEALQNYATSRSEVMSYHDKCQLLRDKIKTLKSSYLSKSSKEDLLGEIRSLETELGFNLGNYNRSDFASSVS